MMHYLNSICFIICSDDRLIMLRISSSKLIFILTCSLISFVLVWCGSGESSTNQTIIDLSWYKLTYNWNVELWRVALKTNDLDEVIDLYQEIWDNVWYRDSLLIAEKYNWWLGINAFVQDNLDTLLEHWLTLSNLEKVQIWLNNNENAVLVNYEITEWFISEVPILYVSQLFIPDKNNVKFVSFISEDSSARWYAINMFKKIQ